MVKNAAIGVARYSMVCWGVGGICGGEMVVRGRD